VTRSRKFSSYLNKSQRAKEKIHTVFSKIHFLVSATVLVVFSSFSVPFCYEPDVDLLAQSTDSVDVLCGEHTTAERVLEAHRRGARVVRVVGSHRLPNAFQVHRAVIAVWDCVKAHAKKRRRTPTFVPNYAVVEWCRGSVLVVLRSLTFRNSAKAQAKKL
jgi:hypothetical protein